jgi:hypothetical protein
MLRNIELALSLTCNITDTIHEVQAAASYCPVTFTKYTSADKQPTAGLHPVVNIPTR